MSWTAIENAISAATGESFTASAASPIMGGSINEAMRLDGNLGTYFVKLNKPALVDMFESEAEGLAEINATGEVLTPAPVCWGEGGEQSWLVLEFINSGYQHSWSSARLGEQLAALHRHSAQRFGWRRDNYIGRTPQPNNESGQWVNFYAEQRLGFQLALAKGQGASASLLSAGELLLADLPVFFSDYQPMPSLLHGDLWGGNWACDPGGNPVIFDPAVYYGDREADIAMTEIFGGFDAEFYRAYNDTWPLDPGYPVRKTLYNLYHVLNHYNLFGGGYASQAGDMINNLLSEIR
ncbi:MAG: fructosamine kinase family protein [Halioglobus sp.]